MSTSGAGWGDAEVDADVRRALVRAQALAALLTTVMTMGGFLMMAIGSAHVIGFAICAVGMMRLFPRPWPLLDRPPDVGIDASGTVVAASRSETLAFVLLVIGVGVGIVVMLATQDVVAMVTADYRGILGGLGIVVYPLILVSAVAWFLSPTRLVLASDGIEVRAGFRTRCVPWDDLLGLMVNKSSLLMLTLVRRGGDDVPVNASRLALSLWELRAVLRHYLEHPEHRGELGTQASLERIEELRREHTVPGWKPDWLPAPRV